MNNSAHDYCKVFRMEDKITSTISNTKRVGQPPKPLPANKISILTEFKERENVHMNDMKMLHDIPQRKDLYGQEGIVDSFESEFSTQNKRLLFEEKNNDYEINLHPEKRIKTISGVTSEFTEKIGDIKPCTHKPVTDNPMKRVSGIEQAASPLKPLRTERDIKSQQVIKVKSSGNDSFDVFNCSAQQVGLSAALGTSMETRQDDSDSNAPLFIQQEMMINDNINTQAQKFLQNHGHIKRHEATHLKADKNILSGLETPLHQQERVLQPLSQQFQQEHNQHSQQQQQQHIKHCQHQQQIHQQQDVAQKEQEQQQNGETLKDQKQQQQQQQQTQQKEQCQREARYKTRETGIKKGNDVEVHSQQQQQKQKNDQGQQQQQQQINFLGESQQQQTVVATVWQQQQQKNHLIASSQQQILTGAHQHQHHYQQQQRGSTSAPQTLPIASAIPSNQSITDNQVVGLMVNPTECLQKGTQYSAPTIVQSKGTVTALSPITSTESSALQLQMFQQGVPSPGAHENERDTLAAHNRMLFVQYPAIGVMVPPLLAQLNRQRFASFSSFLPSPSPRNAGVTLALTCDNEHLSEYQILVRKQLEVFVATQEDVESNTQGRKKQLVLNQVGIRCRHCAGLSLRQRGRGAVYYPAKLQGVYQAAQNMASSHLCESCQCIPLAMKQQLRSLRGRRDTASGGKQYWADGARAMGLYETGEGLRLKLP